MTTHEPYSIKSDIEHYFVSTVMALSNYSESLPEMELSLASADMWDKVNELTLPMSEHDYRMGLSTSLLSDCKQRVKELEAEIVALREQHDNRVTELLEANNRKVESDRLARRVLDRAQEVMKAASCDGQFNDKTPNGVKTNFGAEMDDKRRSTISNLLKLGVPITPEAL